MMAILPGSASYAELMDMPWPELLRLEAKAAEVLKRLAK